MADVQDKNVSGAEFLSLSAPVLGSGVIYAVYQRERRLCDAIGTSKDVWRGYFEYSGSGQADTNIMSLTELSGVTCKTSTRTRAAAFDRYTDANRRMDVNEKSIVIVRDVDPTNGKPITMRFKC